MHQYEKNDCRKRTSNYSHPSKWIVCNSFCNANYKKCLLRPGYSKVKNSMVRSSKNKATQICG